MWGELGNGQLDELARVATPATITAAHQICALAAHELGHARVDFVARTSEHAEERQLPVYVQHAASGNLTTQRLVGGKAFPDALDYGGVERHQVTRIGRCRRNGGPARLDRQWQQDCRESR